MLIDSSEQLRQLTGNYYANNDFSKIQGDIEQATEELAALVMDELDRGVTGIPATGMYSGEARNMLFCVVAKKQIVRLKDLAKGCDPNAFVIVTDVREVLGEGFIEHQGGTGTSV